MKPSIKDLAAAWREFASASLCAYRTTNSHCEAASKVTRWAAEDADQLFVQYIKRFDPEEKFDPTQEVQR